MAASNNTRNSSNNFRRHSLALLAICTFAYFINYWEEIQLWYNSTSSPLVDVSKKIHPVTSNNSSTDDNKNNIDDDNDTTHSSLPREEATTTRSCFNDTATPWHISRNEKFTCTNNREFPPSFLKTLTLTQKKEDDSSFFFKSCEKCCQNMFPNLNNDSLMDCHCNNVCGDDNNSAGATDGAKGGATTTSVIGASSSLLLFCGGCKYLGGDTLCNDRVNFLLHNFPDSNPNEEVAQQNLMRVGHCIELGPEQEQQQQQQQQKMDAPKKEEEDVDEELARVESIAASIGTNNTSGSSIVKVDYKKDYDIIIPTRNMQNEDDTFVGANEWYRYWTMTTNSNIKHINNNMDSSQLTNIDHSHDEHVLSRVKVDSKNAYEHTTKMKARYDEVNAIPDYRARGLGWIEHRLGMILTVTVAGNTAAGGEDDESVAKETETMTVLSAGNVSIFIVDTIGDMKCGGNNNDSGEIPDNWMDYHPPLTMWVRANGPEIFAGTALPHAFASSSSPEDRHRCAWRYDFQAQTPGVYSIYVKALTFNGFADWKKDLCKTKPIAWEKMSTEDNIGNYQIQAAIVHELAEKGNFSHHRGLMAFKNYDQISACCEACTRTSGCRMWSIPGEIDECELFFDNVEDDIDFWDSDMGKHLGRDRNYSYVKQQVSDFPVVRRRLGRKDRRKLAMNRNEINLKQWPGLGVPDSCGYPRDEPALDFIGCGWSCLKSFESPCHYPSDDLIFGSGKRIEITTVGSTYQVDDASIASKVEEKRACSVEDESFGNGRWVKYPFPDDSVCMPVERDLDSNGFKTYMPKYNGTTMPPYCWHRDNIDRCCNSCAEMGCRFIVNHRWVSDLRRDGKWFGRWENYDCYYKDMSSEEIQQCIDRKNISHIEVKGASVKAILDSYIIQKLKGIKMAEPTASSRKIVLDTLKMPHVVWHESVQEFGNELDAYEDIDNETSEYYFVTGFYYSSEREPHVTVDRSLQFSNLAREKLTPKGYKMINGFDVTAAFTFDSDGQNDGLHITGPPTRAILTKFFHHLCHE